MSKHPLGPDVSAGDLVRVRCRAAARPLPVAESSRLGVVLSPGYRYELAQTKAEPGMRVIAVRLIESLDLVDATSWEFAGPTGGR